jgi:hypothetical protein
MNTKCTIRVITFFAVAVFGGMLFATAKPEDEAQKSAEQWLALVDAGNYAESWKTAAGYFQGAVSQEQWEHSLDAVRKPLGALISRKLKNAKYTKSVPGAPDAEYVILQFTTSFTNKKEAVETVTPMLDKCGTWKISGYYIK